MAVIYSKRLGNLGFGHAGPFAETCRVAANTHL